ncbi:MAG: four helix bundle protein [Candidatus Omnitrophica bacterium]|nr:four helix bundle protein [Candidatus Omnitrophota bacterium]
MQNPKVSVHFSASAGRQNSKQYDLEERTLKFAKSVIEFVKTLPKTVANNEIVKQLVRSAGSIGANYIEANESLSRKDFAMRIKICRKESKESIYWLRLIEVNDEQRDKERQRLIKEVTELMKIFGLIVEKCK